MKEYKSILINTDYKNHLDNQLNVFAKKGWYIKEAITRNINENGYGEFIYLLEREVKIWKAAFGSVGFEDRFIEYYANTKDELEELIENETRIEEDESFKYFHEVK